MGLLHVDDLGGLLAQFVRFKRPRHSPKS